MKKGAVFTEKHKKNLSLSHLGIQSSEKNGNWKGKKASYVAIHAWVKRNFGETKKCEFCDKRKTTPRDIQWANKDHKYKRERSDWMVLCAKCHKKYDIEMGLVKVHGKHNPFWSKKHTKEAKEKNRIAHLGKIPWNKKLVNLAIEEA